MLDVVLAVLAGVVTIAAPCILPVLPILFGASVGQTNRARPLFIALGFTVAFSATALIFGAFSSAFGLSQGSLRKLAVAMLMLFGLLMVWPRPLAALAPRLSGTLNYLGRIGEGSGSGNAGGFILGTTLGIVWTPCAGPVLGSILTLIATQQHLAHAGVLLAGYALGAGIPMLVIAYGGQHLTTHIRQVARVSHRLQQAFGVLVILTAAAMYWQYDSVFILWLSSFSLNTPLGT